jgi:hypothetical protein
MASCFLEFNSVSSLKLPKTFYVFISSFSPYLLFSLESNFPLTILLTFASEGDNRVEALSLVEFYNQWADLVSFYVRKYLNLIMLKFHKDNSFNKDSSDYCKFNFIYIQMSNLCTTTTLGTQNVVVW